MKKLFYVVMMMCFAVSFAANNYPNATKTTNNADNAKYSQQQQKADYNKDNTTTAAGERYVNGATDKDVHKTSTSKTRASRK